MRRLVLATLGLVVCSSASALAQSGGTPDVVARRDGATSPKDSIFRRARRLVSAGNGAAGRALVDSLLLTELEGTRGYGDALYWQGALAETAAAAERTYRRVIVEYPLSTYSEDALLALAELEQARGDRAAALAHLQRFVREHPDSPGRAVAAFAAARLAFEQRDNRTGCTMIADARASVASADVELRNQIDFYATRCPDTTTPAVARATSPAHAPVPIPAATPVEPATEAVVATTAPAPTAKTAASRSTPTRTTTTTSIPGPPPAATTPPPSPASTMSLRRDTAAKTPASRGSYSIQLAAYNTRADAQQLVASLARRDVKARISGTQKPFRVRLGFYRTRQQAADEVSALKARGIIAFVTTEPVEGAAP